MSVKKLIITAKCEAEGTSLSDIQSPLQVTEIATELIITRLGTISMLGHNQISRKSVIVTAPERICLYTKIFDEVLDWETYVANKQNYSHLEVDDLLDPARFASLSAGPVESRLIQYKPFYHWWERDKDKILNVEEPEDFPYDVSKKFACLVIRTRAAWPEKNLPKSYWDKVITEFRKNGIPLFVFGKETEVYEQPGVTHIPTFKEWCHLSKHKNCSAVISTITGGVYPALIFGHKDITLTIIDNLDLVKVYGYDPSWYNDCINFAGLKKRILTQIPEPRDLVEDFLYGK